ncbi:MAG: ATP--guanido phosphotransferase, partial [Verrucomicrobiales bacterium]|nr:ATP--guanido phosphotransferase [Verrucomicrobiales bacterium]
MKFSTLLKNPAEWMESSGPNGDIVITSRVRLARNLRNFSFPGWSEKSDRVASLAQVLPPVLALPEMADAFSTELDKLNALKKQVLVERHLISREHA